MYVTKYLEIGSGETKSVKMFFPYPAQNFAVWVKPGDAYGTSMNYVVRVLYSGEEQIRWERNISSVDIFRDTLLPGRDETDMNKFFPLDIEVEIQNNAASKKIFYIAFISKSLAEEW